MRLGEVLRKWRMSQELTLRQVAKLIGTTHSTLSRIENGFQPDGKTLMLIFNFLTERK